MAIPIYMYECAYFPGLESSTEPILLFNLPNKVVSCIERIKFVKKFMVVLSSAVSRVLFRAYCFDCCSLSIQPRGSL